METKLKTELDRFFKRVLGASYEGVSLWDVVHHQLADGLAYAWVDVRSHGTVSRVRLPVDVSLVSAGLVTAGVTAGPESDKPE